MEKWDNYKKYRFIWVPRHINTWSVTKVSSFKKENYESYVTGRNHTYIRIQVMWIRVFSFLATSNSQNTRWMKLQEKNTYSNKKNSQKAYYICRTRSEAQYLKSATDANKMVKLKLLTKSCFRNVKMIAKGHA